MLILHKFKGADPALPSPPRASWRHIGLAWLGSLLAMGALASATHALSLALVLGSFGASCVLVFGYPDLPFSQPRNVLCGHVLSAAVGLACLHGIGPQAWSMALAVATAVALMMALRVVHPPAGSNPVIVFLASAPWSFLLFPVLIGALLLLIVALVYLNMSRAEPYPRSW